MPVKYHDYTKGFFMGFEEAKMKSLEESADKLRELAWNNAPGTPAQKVTDIQTKIVGTTTVALLVGGKTKYHEFGTGIRGDPNYASGETYSIPKDLDRKLRSVDVYNVEYRSFRTKSGKVKTIPRKVKDTELRGMRKKVLYIPGIGFRWSVKYHPGVKAIRFATRAMDEMQNYWWDEIWRKNMARVRKFVSKSGSRPGSGKAMPFKESRDSQLSQGPVRYGGADDFK